jgi:hypothetical protein
VAAASVAFVLFSQADVRQTGARAGEGGDGGVGDQRFGQAYVRQAGARAGDRGGGDAGDQRFVQADVRQAGALRAASTMLKFCTGYA